MSESSEPEIEDLPPDVVPLRGNSAYVGSRAAATALRERMHAVSRAGEVVKADATGVAVMTPVFVEECFGVLFQALGEEVFQKSLRLKNANESCVLLVEAMLQRLAGPGKGETKEDQRVEGSEAEDDDVGTELSDDEPASDSDRGDEEE